MNNNRKRINHNTAQYSTEPTLSNLSKAIFTINRHAKTAPDPKFLYSLKKKALIKLLKEGKAEKKGLHFSNNPKYSQQRSDILISVGDFYFHMPPTKEDLKELKHLGHQNQSYRNPKVHMSLGQAKAILQKYTGHYPSDDHHKVSSNQWKKSKKPVFKKLGEPYF